MHSSNNFFNLSKYKIMVIENGNDISNSLKEKNILSTVYTTLEKASIILKKDLFNILVLDFSNSSEEDLKLLKNIKKDNQDLYIILLIDINKSSISLNTLEDLSVYAYCDKKDKLNQLPFFIESAIKSIEQIKMINTMNEELLQSKELLVKSYLESIETLRYIVEAKDTYTIGHYERVSEYSILIGKKLGLNSIDLKTIKIGGLFHDIGKIGISDTILLKKEKLTLKEYEQVKKHPIIGKNILSNTTIFKDVLPIVIYHHERYDGRGYPYGLAGRDIPLLARIVCVADAFDAMTSKRSYRNELDIAYVKNIINSESGFQFDPHIAKVFLDILNNEYHSIIEIKNRY